MSNGCERSRTSEASFHYEESIVLIPKMEKFRAVQIQAARTTTTSDTWRAASCSRKMFSKEISRARYWRAGYPRTCHNLSNKVPPAALTKCKRPKQPEFLHSYTVFCILQSALSHGAQVGTISGIHASRYQDTEVLTEFFLRSVIMLWPFSTTKCAF